MKIKICNICNLEKELQYFHKWKYSKDGYRYECKECRKEKTQIYRNINKIKLQEYSVFYKKNNTEKIKEGNEMWRKENPNYQREYYNRKKTDELFRLKLNVRSRIRDFLKHKKITKKNTTFNIIGCSPIELKEYIESKFSDGMTWENYGKWHIDHIVPLCRGKNKEEIFNLCYFSNLQPLWAKENWKKKK